MRLNLSNLFKILIKQNEELKNEPWTMQRSRFLVFHSVRAFWSAVYRPRPPRMVWSFIFPVPEGER